MNDKSRDEESRDELALHPIPALLSPRLRNFMFVSFFLVIATILCLFIWAFNAAADNYEEVSCLAKTYYQDNKLLPHVRPDVAMLYTIQAARAQDLLLIKAGGIMLGFLISFMGGALTLTGMREYYQLKVQNAEVSTALQTSSPGLVLITMGIIVVVVLSQTTTEIKTDVGWISTRTAPRKENVEKSSGTGKKRTESPRKDIFQRIDDETK